MDFLINYLFISIPEMYVMMIWGATVLGHQFNAIKYRTLFMAAAAALVSDLLWYFNLITDFRIIIEVFSIFVLYKIFFKMKWRTSFVMTVFALISALISEIILFSIFLNFIDYDQIMNSLLTKFILTILYLIPIIIGIWYLNIKNTSITIWYRKKFMNKRITYYWLSILFLALLQLFVIIYLNYSFYMKNTFLHKKVIFNIYGLPFTSILLIITNVFLILFIMKVMNLNAKKEINRTESSYNRYLEGLLDKLKMERHDFVNELNTINGLIQANLYDQLQDYMSNIIHNSKRINRVIQIKNPTVSAFLHTKIEQIESEGIAFNINVNTSDSFSIIKGYDLVKMISNLLDNALHATSNATVKKPFIELYWGKVDNKAIIKISNNGPKINKKVIDLMFKKGYTTKKDNENSGYGLAIVKGAIDKYKGQILVESTEKITSFTIEIPLV